MAYSGTRFKQLGGEIKQWGSEMKGQGRLPRCSPLGETLIQRSGSNKVRQIQAFAIRLEFPSTVLPGDKLKVKVPDNIDQDGTLAIDRAPDKMHRFKFNRS